GYEPDVEIPIVFTKIRPGEKLFEEILTDSEKPTKYEKIFIAKLNEINEEKLSLGLRKLAEACKEMERGKIIEILKELLPNYQPKSI
ncbi:nucleoside-diphosphate sugar epimerase, partial [bacterium (Candidatus Moisslbacteria) CG12_big_fil_rev_8_21_14_0_65_36_11]